jgi:hypothetical protein
LLRKDRPSRPLVDELVSRQGDHQHIALAARRLQMAHVTDVE